jgi:hypothetical protein
MTHQRKCDIESYNGGAVVVQIDFNYLLLQSTGDSSDPTIIFTNGDSEMQFHHFLSRSSILLSSYPVIIGQLSVP